MAAIIALTSSSTLLVACLAIATLNVILRRESTSVIEKQINTLVEASRSIAPAILDRAGICAVPNANSRGLMPLTRYVQSAFPQAQISLVTNRSYPHWLPDTGFTGIVVDQ